MSFSLGQQLDFDHALHLDVQLARSLVYGYALRSDVRFACRFVDEFVLWSGGLCKVVTVVHTSCITL